MPKKLKHLVQFLATLAAIYAVLLVVFRFTDEKTQFITDNWSLSSKENLFLYPLIQVVTLALILGGAVFGLWLAYRMLLSEHRRLWFGGFFAVLGIAGILIWALVSSAEEKAATRHIPVIGGMFAALGVVFGIFFKPKDPGKRRRER